ncbi:MAG: GTPase Era [Chloroflexi bacterium]|nr:GTPase Era [Chloroflexota bacterium]
MDPDLPENHRSGFVAVVGKPNVGKSTLMNALLGEKLAIVTPRPQTTRERQLGILTTNVYQMVFIDTPGLTKPGNKLDETMAETVREAITDGDVVLVIVDASHPPTRADKILAEAVSGAPQDASVVLALNKIDLAGETGSHAAEYEDLFARADPVAVSALEGTGVEELHSLLIERLPFGPRFYPAEQLTQTRLRDNVAEIVREKLLLLYRDEVPHAAAVVVDEFTERDENMTYISATIYVERDSQKGIIIGKGGSGLKKIGQAARPDIEAVVGTRVYLEVWVKVLKNWRTDENALRRLGYRRS